MTVLKVKNTQLAKLREFRKGMDLEDFMSNEFRQVIRALEGLYVDSPEATTFKETSSYVESSSCGTYSTVAIGNPPNLS